MKRQRLRGWLVLTLATIALGACSADAPLNFLHPEGPIARRADKLWDLTFGIATVVFILVEGALVFIIVRYRQKSRADAPRQHHGNTKLEIVWTIVPALLLVFVAIPTVGGILFLSAKPAGALEVEVIAHQWWWEYRYPNGVVTATEMHIPVGRDVVLNLKSVDVIHSFWVPKLAGKQDVVPGRINKLRLFADTPGEYQGQCAEFCGLSHANMRLKVFAESSDDFNRWLKEQGDAALPPAEALGAQGKDLFVNGQCAGCHTIKGTPAEGTIGPNLTHFASRTTFAGSMFDLNVDNLAAWLRNPPGRKPGSRMPNLHLAEEDIDALVAYLLTLR